MAYLIIPCIHLWCDLWVYCQCPLAALHNLVHSPGPWHHLWQMADSSRLHPQIGRLYTDNIKRQINKNTQSTYCTARTALVAAFRSTITTIKLCHSVYKMYSNRLTCLVKVFPAHDETSQDEFSTRFLKMLCMDWIRLDFPAPMGPIRRIRRCSASGCFARIFLKFSFCSLFWLFKQHIQANIQACYVCSFTESWLLCQQCQWYAILAYSITSLNNLLK